MSENIVVEIKKRGTTTDDALTEMLKTGAQQPIHQAVQAELAVFMEQYSAERKWRKLRGFDFLNNVIKGVQFKDGVEIISNCQVAA